MPCITGQDQEHGAHLNVGLTASSKADVDDAVAAALENAAGFGLWRYDWRTGLVNLTDNAGALLGFSGAGSLPREDICAYVAPDDSMDLMEVLAGKLRLGQPPLEFRVIDGQSGMRWLRATLLPASAPGARCIEQFCVLFLEA